MFRRVKRPSGLSEVPFPGAKEGRANDRDSSGWMDGNDSWANRKRRGRRPITKRSRGVY